VPTVDRRRLCADLRRLRSQNNMSVEDVARALRWTRSKVVRIESGRREISRADLRRLLVEYQVADAGQAAGLVAMAGRMYLWIAEDLARKLESGELDLGSRLPTERELTGQYNATLKAVRDALRWLQKRGLGQWEPDADSLRLAQQEHKSALRRVQRLNEISAKARGSLGSSLPTPFSRQTSVRGRMTASRESLRGPTLLPVSYPNRGMAAIAR
jgi:transcriptional regulator with XRE-family HTH domain